MDYQELYNEYSKIQLNVENVIFAKNLSFGIIVSHEDHVVLGCISDFIVTYKKGYKKWTSGKEVF